MKKSQIRLCEAYMTDHLTQLGTELEEHLNIPKESQGLLGLKVWVLPPKYFSLMFHERHWLLAWADLLSLTFGRFQLVSVGEVSSREHVNINRQAFGSTAWTIGKGLLGQAIFAEGNAAEQPVFGLVHRTEWAAEIDSMSHRTFRRLGRTKRRGMSQDDIRRLRSLYGTAVAVPIKIQESSLSFGCLTAHLPRRHCLDSAQMQECSTRMAAAVPGLAQVLVARLHYRPLVDIVVLPTVDSD